MKETQQDIICGFEMAWVGKCKDAPTKDGRCDKHQDKACCSCGQPATHECYETGQFVCGAPLCDECEHAIAPDGTNGGVGFYSTIPEDMQASWKTHIKKSEQKFLPWYARETSASSI